MDAYSNAKDMELLRSVLKIRKINIYGFSYGTLLSERYLGLFGENVNGSILEGVMNPNQNRTEFFTTAASSTEAADDRFNQWCQNNEACVLRGRDIPDVLEQSRAKVRTGEIAGASYMGVPWTEPVVTGYVERNIGRGKFAEAAKGIKDLSEGKNPEIQDAPETQDDEPGSESDLLPEKIPYPGPIVCSSFALGVPDAPAAREDLASMRAVAPVMRYNTESVQYSPICVGATTRPHITGACDISECSPNDAPE